MKRGFGNLVAERVPDAQDVLSVPQPGHERRAIRRPEARRASPDDRDVRPVTENIESFWRQVDPLVCSARLLRQRHRLARSIRNDVTSVTADSSLRKVLPDTIAARVIWLRNGLCARADGQLQKDPLDMRFDCFRRDLECSSDPLVGETLADFAKISRSRSSEYRSWRFGG